MDINWTGVAIAGAVVLALNAFVIYQWRDFARWARMHPTPRAAWMFEDNAEGTIAHGMQMFRLAITRARVSFRKSIQK